jgi:hypothetical protein
MLYEVIPNIETDFIECGYVLVLRFRKTDVEDFCNSLPEGLPPSIRWMAKLKVDRTRPTLSRLSKRLNELKDSLDKGELVEIHLDPQFHEELSQTFSKRRKALFLDDNASVDFELTNYVFCRTDDEIHPFAIFANKQIAVPAIKKGSQQMPIRFPNRKVRKEKTAYSSLTEANFIFC